MNQESAAYAHEVATVAALKADATLTGRLGSNSKVFSLVAPQGAVLPYIVLGATSEAWGPYFGRAANAGQIVGDIYGATADKGELLKVFEDVARILHGPLTITGWTGKLARVAFVTALLDPVSLKGHGVFTIDRELVK